LIFESFSVILRQISLGVPTVRRRSFSLSYEKILQKSRFLGLCRNARSNFARSADSTPSFIFLVLRKNPSKIETLDLCRNARSNVTRSTFARRRSFSLSYEKILQKSRFWVFSVILQQMSLGVHSYAVVHFPCLTKKSFKNRDFLGLCRNARSNFARSTFARCCSFSLPYEKILQKSRLWVFSEILRQISLGVPTVRRRSFSDRATKCVTRFTFNTNFNLCHSSG
jgi:hypothetical protein